MKTTNFWTGLFSFSSNVQWGGISSEEHDEAVMLEAALFGGLPEGSGLGLPYHARRGIHTDVLDDIAGGESAGLMAAFNRRGFPQPPSPTVVAQRLLREQQVCTLHLRSDPSVLDGA